MDRWAVAPLALAALIATGAAEAAVPLAPPLSPTKTHKLKPIPSLNLSDIGAPLFVPREGKARPVARLTEPATAGLVAPPRYVIGREGSAATGKRATLSIAIGETRLFAIGGKIPARQRAGLTAEAASDARTSAPQKLESGRLYGGGIERKVGAFELGAQYQFSTINGQELDPTADGRAFGIDIDDKSKSHSVRATARLRF